MCIQFLCHVADLRLSWSQFVAILDLVYYWLPDIWGQVQGFSFSRSLLPPHPSSISYLSLSLSFTTYPELPSFGEFSLLSSVQDHTSPIPTNYHFLYWKTHFHIDSLPYILWLAIFPALSEGPMDPGGIFLSSPLPGFNRLLPCRSRMSWVPQGCFSPSFSHSPNLQGLLPFS